MNIPLRGGRVAGEHTLTETESMVDQKLDGLILDFEAMAIASNLFRAANAVRNHMERTVLAPHDLTWTAFVVLWVTWIWEPIETRAIAAEGGFSKATLSGVLTTLESRRLVSRSKSESDGRLVMVKLTPAGRRLMKKLFPKFNAEERFVVANIKPKQRGEAADMLRAICLAVKN
jgi:DNA-binding MarR family transcriptional regulator